MMFYVFFFPASHSSWLVGQVISLSCQLAKQGANTCGNLSPCGKHLGVLSHHGNNPTTLKITFVDIKKAFFR